MAPQVAVPEMIPLQRRKKSKKRPKPLFGYITLTGLLHAAVDLMP
jgi:type II secretory pathway component PulC